QRALVALGVGALDVADVLGLLEGRHDGADDLAVLGARVLGPVPALDQDALGVLLGEVRGYSLVGTAGLAGSVLVVGERLHADRAADEYGQDHEREPSEDGLLSMLSALSTGARSEVVRAVGAGTRVHGVSLGLRRRPSNVACPRACGADSRALRCG